MARRSLQELQELIISRVGQLILMSYPVEIDIGPVYAYSSSDREVRGIHPPPPRMSRVVVFMLGVLKSDVLDPGKSIFPTGQYVVENEYYLGTVHLIEWDMSLYPLGLLALLEQENDAVQYVVGDEEVQRWFKQERSPELFIECAQLLSRTDLVPMEISTEMG